MPQARITRYFKRRRGGSYGRRKRARFNAPMRISRGVRTSSLHRFTRSFVGSVITGNDVSYATNAALTMTLSGLPNYAEFTALYDQYRITGVKIRWILRRDPTQATTAANKDVYPKLAIARDHTDSNTPASAAELLEYSNSKYRQLTPDKDTYSIFVKPSVQMVSYKTAVTSGYTPKWGQWLSTADSTVPHYGLKWNIEPVYAGVTVEVFYKVYLQCKVSK